MANRQRRVPAGEGPAHRRPRLPKIALASPIEVLGMVFVRAGGAFRTSQRATGAAMYLRRFRDGVRPADRPGRKHGLPVDIAAAIARAMERANRRALPMPRLNPCRRRTTWCRFLARGGQYGGSGVRLPASARGGVAGAQRRDADGIRINGAWRPHLRLRSPERFVLVCDVDLIEETAARSRLGQVIGPEVVRAF
jgi:hypothetical protein